MTNRVASTMTNRVAAITLFIFLISEVPILLLGIFMLWRIQENRFAMAVWFSLVVLGVVRLFVELIRELIVNQIKGLADELNGLKELVATQAAELAKVHTPPKPDK